MVNTTFESKESLERQIYDLKNLIELGRSLASNLEFHSLVESILYSCIGQMFVDKVAIMLQVDIDVPDFYIHMSKGYDPDFEKSNIIIYEGSPLVRYFESKPVCHNFSQLISLGIYKDELEKMNQLSPNIIVPMMAKNSLNGLIILGDKLTGDSFTDSEREFLHYLAKFAAIAVDNSRLYLMATLDRMTRLYIHHYFKERLMDELKRSVRFGTPLSIIMSDIDHFKKFNDTYGHQQGDSVLKQTAALFRENIRSIDIPARYGGEEFAIILPDTDLAGALTIASRLRKKVEEFQFHGQGDPLHVTVSLGVAQFDQERDAEIKDLISRADSCLYKAKELGRNRVVGHK